MALESGTRLGPYEILEPIGKGGMGEVYRARDTKLDRDVAIKVLPEEFASDPERLARFEREAKLLASLNHPNIASIHGFEESDGVNALVLELVEGPTLAERIEQRPLPVDEAIAVAKQIAEALEAGHEAGVIHRDLKPANIKLKDDGTVKVLDYGLAKAWEGDASSGVDSDLSQSPTLTRQGTQVGVILGTAAYMSPEQAKGKRVDKRADIWAFGALLYEMVTGKRPFAGEDVSETLAYVLTKEPDWSALPKDLTPSLRLFLMRCLAKEPKERVHDIADVRLAMDGAFDAAPASSESVGSQRSVLPWAVAALAIVLAGVALWSRPSSDPQAVTRFEYEIPTGSELRFRSRRTLAVSPDGRRFAYNTRRGVYVRSMDQLDPQLLPGTEPSIAGIYFSPDGQSIAFFQDGQLKRVALTGGAPIVICSLPFSPFSAHWADDGVVYFAGNNGIYGVQATGGEPELIIGNTDDESFDSPFHVPESDTLLVSVFGGGDGNMSAGGFQALRGSARWDSARIEAVSLSSGARTELVSSGSAARFVPPGHLVFAQADGLVAVPFNVRTLRVIGGPVSVVEGVVRAGSTASTDYAVSRNGTLFYLAGDSLSTGRLAWLDREGNADVIETIPPNQYQYPRLSPDGERLLVIAAGDARIFELASGRESRLSTDGVTQYLGWAPSGEEITYSTAPAGRDQEIWIQAADGSGIPRQVNSAGGEIDFDDWAPSGRRFSAHEHILAFSRDAQPPLQRNAAAKTTIVIFSYEGETMKAETWLENAYWNHNAVFSPDERYVAYLSNETGAFELYIRPFPGPGGQTTVSVGGASEPVWAKTGELFYRRPGDYMLMAVDVSTDPVLEVGAPVELFRGTDPGGSTTARYTVTADGERFIMSTTLLASDGSSGHSVVVVENWIEELRERVPSP